LEHCTRREVSRCARHRTTGMSARSGEVEALDATKAPGPEAALEQLVAQHLAMEDVAAGEPEAVLELARAERQAVDYAVRQLRADRGEAGDRRIGGRVGVGVRREALTEHRQNVSSGGRQRGIGRRLAGG